MYYITGKGKINLKKPVIYASEKTSTKPGKVIQVFNPEFAVRRHLSPVGNRIDTGT